MTTEPRNIMGDTYVPQDNFNESSRMSAYAVEHKAMVDELLRDRQRIAFELMTAKSAVGHLAGRVADLEDERARLRDALALANEDNNILQTRLRLIESNEAQR